MSGRTCRLFRVFESDGFVRADVDHIVDCVQGPVQSADVDCDMAILQFPLRVELELEFLREDAAGLAVEFEACIVLPALVVAEDVPDCVVVDREIAESAVVGLLGFS